MASVMPPVNLADALTPEAEMLIAAKKAEEAAVVEAPAAETVEKSDYADLIDRLTKGDFGNAEAANNGNPDAKATPMGGAASFTAGVKTAADEERNVDGAEARVAASVKRSRGAQPPAPPTNLNKADEEEDDLIKADDEIGEDDIYSELVDGEGAEGFVPVAEASEAIQFLTDTMAKSVSHLSAQVAALSKELHGRNDEIEKSMSLIREAQAALLKSNAVGEPIKKSLATVPASGVVVIAKAEEKDDKKEAPKSGALMKSITAAMTSGDVDTNVGSRLLRTLDTKGPAAAWDSMTTALREKIAGAAN